MFWSNKSVSYLQIKREITMTRSRRYLMCKFFFVLFDWELWNENGEEVFLPYFFIKKPGQNSAPAGN